VNTDLLAYLLQKMSADVEVRVCVIDTVSESGRRAVSRDCLVYK